MVGAVNLDFLARFVNQLDLGTHSLGRLGTALWVDNDECGQAGNFIHLLGNRCILLYVLELDRAGVFGNDRTRMRVPCCELRSGLHSPSVVSQKGCTVWNLVAFPLATIVVGNHHLPGAGDDDLLVLRIRYVTHGCGKPDHARTLGLDTALRRGTRRSTANVECAHGQLRPRFANRLGSNNADRFAGTNQGAASQVTAIALGAKTITGFAGQRTAYTDFVDIQLFDDIHSILAEQGARRKNDFLGVRMNNIICCHSTENALT